MPLTDELRAGWREMPPMDRAALGVIIVVGIAIRALVLDQPIRYDEAVTYLEFARRPLGEALSLYTYPNNHLLHTLLVKGAVAVFGDSPWALRLPAFLAGIAIIPLSYVAVRVLYGARIALVATAFVATSGVLVLFSANARGYSFVTLAFLGLVIAAERIVRTPSRSALAAYAIIAALGLWAVPVMLFPLGAVSLWIVLSYVVDGRRAQLWPFAGALALGAVLTLLLYWPVLAHSGLRSVAANKFVASSLWPQFFDDLQLNGWYTLRSWALGLPPLISPLFLLAAVYALARHGSVAKQRVGLPVAAYAWCAWLLVVTHRAPFARVWQWTVPLVAALAAAGILLLFERWQRGRVVAERYAIVAMSLAVLTGASVALSGAVERAGDTGAFPDAESTAVQLHSLLKPGDAVIAPIPDNAPLAYYFHRMGADASYLTADPRLADRIYVIVNAAAGHTIEEAVAGTPAADTTQFSATLVADRPESTMYLFTLKDATR